LHGLSLEHPATMENATKGPLLSWYNFNAKALL